MTEGSAPHWRENKHERKLVSKSTGTNNRENTSQCLKLHYVFAQQMEPSGMDHMVTGAC